MAEFGFEEEDVGEGEGGSSFFLDISEEGASEFLSFTK
jgi:hypothetical protein